MNYNPFSLTFGKEPQNLINDVDNYESIRSTFLSLNPTSMVSLITGVRGSGKTVLLSRLYKYFDTLDDWIVVELNPETDMLEYLASSIYEKANMKLKFMKKEFSFSFKGVSISISGENPVSNVITLLEKMLDVLKKKNIKVLICIDDVSSNKNVKVFVQQFQIFIRNNYSLFLLMTGLYENVRTLQNEKSLTFLYRAPQISMNPLSLISICESFIDVLNVDRKDAIEMAKLTNGYAFAYQVLGYILFEKKKKKIDDDVIKDFDKYLREYVYEKVYFDLPLIERNIVNFIAKEDDGNSSSIMESLNINRENFSQYRSKLLKKGILSKASWGKLEFALPRFKEYVLLQIAFL